MSNFLNIVQERCPNCGKTHVFKTKGNPFIFQIPKMKSSCEACNYSYHREPGFYFGAMYVSYALSVAEMITIMLLGLVFSLSYFNIILLITAAIFALWTINYRYARVIWLYIFKNAN